MPVLGRSHATYPNIVLDVTIGDSVTDIVQAGHDVGARFGEFLEADMVAGKLGSERRQLVVALPKSIGGRRPAHRHTATSVRVFVEFLRR